ncbi:MAG: hypothetical protein J2P28_23485 [Actinobacteria bacterium]|nr:hypothetical protein [Actinomycetota bacterium]
MTGAWWDDDDQLLSAVKTALAAADEVPRRFVEIGKASFAWRDIDAELAALTYDSADDALAGAGTRAEPASLRCLTFDASQLTIEIEVIGEALHGQLVPPQPGEVEIRHADGTSSTAPVNDVGYFTATPVPAGTFRIYCHTANDIIVQTDWITL